MFHLENIRPEDFTNIASIITAISTLGLFFASCIGLYQLKITRDASKATAKRDALRSANEQIFYFTDVILPLFTELDEAIKEHNIKVFDVAKINIGINNITVEMNSTDTEGEKLFLIIEQVANVINALECFSSYFISELADEKTAFRAAGKSYCNNVEKYLPVIIIIAKAGYLKNTIDLFIMWRKRLKIEENLTNKNNRRYELNF